jgi:hypothetical protein
MPPTPPTPIAAWLESLHRCRLCSADEEHLDPVVVMRRMVGFLQRWGWVFGGGEERRRKRRERGERTEGPAARRRVLRLLLLVFR